MDAVEESGFPEPRQAAAGEGWRLVDVLLTGGAPWGFTIRGGVEYREPLLITKVEDGSKAAAVRLQTGDELVCINRHQLTGYRQEAICLVKGSHKTLTLVVKRKMKMVDIVAQKVPSESDVHVARSFLTKILRSSMRRNESVSRPHSWHSTKFTDGQSEVAKAQATPSPVWQTRYDASSSSTDLSSAWDQTNLCRVSDQFSSLGSMDSLDHASHPYPSGRLSPGKSNDDKRDSAYSSFSTSSGTPDYTLSRSNAASTENVLGKVNQWDSAGRHSNGRHGQDERPAYLQLPTEEQPGSRHSSSSRTSFGPVWHVPDKRRKSAPSPPPPPPPARSDSFAAIKVHEKGLVIPYPDGPGSHQSGEKGPEARRGANPPPKHDGVGPSISNDVYIQQPDKRYSSSSAHQTYHQRQYSDESTFPGPARGGYAPKPAGAGGYYSSMQELPTQFYGHNLGRTSSASHSTPTIDQNPDSGDHNRYYRVTPQASVSQASVLKVEDWKGGAEDRSSFDAQGLTKPRYSAAQVPPHVPNDRDGDVLRPEYLPAAPLEASTATLYFEQVGGHRRNSGSHVDSYYLSYPPSKQAEQRRSVGSLPPKEPSQGEGQICPQKTPMLHSLSQLSQDVEQDNPSGAAGLAQETLDQLSGKQVRRNDRFATTLRSEIQMKRAQLQKSRSAAALSDTAEGEEEAPGNLASPSEGSFTTTYKDHLKEAQARVLKATSFKRRDLEPLLPEYPEFPVGYPPPFASRKDSLPLSSVSEAPQDKPMSRIGSRKRIPAEKKVRSFSEPDMIHEVGVNGRPPPPDSASSLVDRRKFFEATGKPAFPKPVPKHVKKNVSVEHRVSQPLAIPQSGPSEEALREDKAYECDPGAGQQAPNSITKDALLEQQRLGTFAEYEAQWNVQRKAPESRSSGRCQSADNILDPGGPDRSRQSYVHERSRSSPSADFYGQNVPEHGGTSHERSEEDASGKRGHRVKEDPPPPEHFPEPPTHPVTGENPVTRAWPADPAPQHPDHHWTKGPESLRPAPPHLDKNPSRDSLSAPEGGASSEKPGPASVPSSFPQRDSGWSRGSKREDKEEEQLEAESAPPPAPLTPPQPGRTKPTMEGQRSPSPQFAPQRLTDKPPVSLQDEAPGRMETLNEVTATATVKKVPIKIVHAESETEKESRQYLHTIGGEDVPEPSVAHLASLAGPDLSSSPFCAYSRPREPDAPPAEPQGNSTGARLRFEEEEKREELARNIIGKDKSLADILDRSKMKTTMDLMEGIFPQGEQLLEGAHQRRKAAPKQASPRGAEERKEEDSQAAAVALVTNSTYYSTSAPKAELLNKMKDMQQDEEQDSEDELDHDLANKKHELIDSLSRKLQVLREARESLQEDVQDNNTLGEEVEVTVKDVCKPNELEKFRMFVGDLDKVVSLLLSLSGRLARVENALNSLEEDVSPDERRTLQEKRKLLIRQHEDAKELKENLDRRERVVFDILASHLEEERLADYEHFVKMKSALIIEQRKLEDKIKLGEEQLKCLMDSLPLDQRLPI
ncbi:protein Shroom2 isoform X2 [Denticeps clupeoides]|uniref:protein Shroom2 isoform X2 n=1 Tax=Denticeps clupeoides TaxID=299321 RepID=UPI0010A4D2A4|nr:protein Shroom2 isoform X2 [Denticeps clupeoides]